ncbi:MAG: glycosyltransferase family 2 protein [Blastocatellales bacterium]
MFWPKISIITPSYNQGQYLEDTIISIIDQNYPQLEYIIIDGGSTDDSVSIIKKYEEHITYWVSEPDEGQSYALNKGFSLSSGEIIGWLNSDDLYCKNVLLHIGELFRDNPDWQVINGGLLVIDSMGRIIDAGWPLRNDPRYTYLIGLDIHQQALFWRKSVFEDVGYLNQKYDFSMDYDFILRMISLYRTHRTQKFIGMYRVHESAKSALILDRCLAENSLIRSLLHEKYKDRFPFHSISLSKLYLRIIRIIKVAFDAPVMYLLFKLFIKLTGRSRFTDRLAGNFNK